MATSTVLVGDTAPVAPAVAWQRWRRAGVVSACVLVLAGVSGCSAVGGVVGVESACEESERLNRELAPLVDHRDDETYGDVIDRVAELGSQETQRKVEEALEVSMECALQDVRDTPLPE